MENLIFKKISLDYKGIIYNWIKDPYLRKMIGTRSFPSLEEHRIWIENKIKDTKNLLFVIEVNNKPVGIIGTNTLDLYNKNAEIYIYIGDSKKKNNGIGTRSLQKFIKYLNEKYELNKVNARIFSYNIPSIKLFEKNGFILEARLKKQIYLSDDGLFYDLLWYSYFLK
ncbi:GNAT family N-acetyltransferase [Peptostreptococcus equinus]|uniref:GNAT family protein n=1 Tax=Peptostreptococcus equinus TaxID=3003601 RepID=A0ABY7JNV0_9FIRM|nr:GNAT family protein [Peptostreptococcus sp. CBA3647]WAW14159.1 GNAT family protein [Peptostreptococcus sp. CBA3647]